MLFDCSFQEESIQYNGLQSDPEVVPICDSGYFEDGESCSEYFK